MTAEPAAGWIADGPQAAWTAAGRFTERLRPSEVNPNLPSAPDAGHYSSFCLDSVMRKMWRWNGVETHNFFLRGMQFCQSRHVTCEVMDPSHNAQVIKNNSSCGSNCGVNTEWKNSAAKEFALVVNGKNSFTFSKLSMAFIITSKHIPTCRVPLSSTLM